MLRLMFLVLLFCVVAATRAHQTHNNHNNHHHTHQQQQHHNKKPPRPLSQQQISVTVCEGALCRQNCRVERGMPQNQCREEGGGRQQKAECAPPPMGKMCIQQTVYKKDKWQPPPPARGGGNNNNQCLDKDAIDTSPHMCDTCVDNRVHAHGRPHMEFIKFTNCSGVKPAAGGSFVLHSACNGDCSRCDTHQVIDSKQCYSEEVTIGHSVEVRFAQPRPCAGRLIVQDFQDFNHTVKKHCMGQPFMVSTTFEQQCYSEHRGGKLFSTSYKCE